MPMLSCSAPLPEDLFSGLEDLTLTLGAPAAEMGPSVTQALEEAASVGHAADEMAQLSPGRLPRQVRQHVVGVMQMTEMSSSSAMILIAQQSRCPPD